MAQRHYHHLPFGIMVALSISSCDDARKGTDDVIDRVSAIEPGGASMVYDYGACSRVTGGLFFPGDLDLPGVFELQPL